MAQHSIAQFKAGELTFDDLNSRYAVRFGDDIVTGELKSYSAYQADQDGIPVEDDSLPDVTTDGKDLDVWADVIEVNLYVGHRELVTIQLSPETMIERLGKSSYLVRH